ncbi:MAG: hypothetical protein M3O22_02720 [Pseudomonadota bacterium]|nr:hypothetical protein [Pseudomonadota bacterium]
MANRKNPLGLNALQLKTLALLQELARMPETSAPGNDEGSRAVIHLPHPHGNHFHLGRYVVMTQDASGLFNPAPWAVLERKGLIRSMFPDGAVVTAEGLAYDTGVRDQILHSADH